MAFCLGYLEIERAANERPSLLQLNRKRGCSRDRDASSLQVGGVVRDRVVRDLDVRVTVVTARRVNIDAATEVGIVVPHHVARDGHRPNTEDARPRATGDGKTLDLRSVTADVDHRGRLAALGEDAVRYGRGVDDGRGVIAHARSSDLVQWAVLPPITKTGLFAQMEVPQIISADDQYYLLFSKTYNIS